MKSTKTLLVATLALGISLCGLQANRPLQLETTQKGFITITSANGVTLEVQTLISSNSKTTNPQPDLAIQTGPEVNPEPHFINSQSDLGNATVSAKIVDNKVEVTTVWPNSTTDGFGYSAVFLPQDLSPNIEIQIVDKVAEGNMSFSDTQEIVLRQKSDKKPILTIKGEFASGRLQGVNISDQPLVIILRSVPKDGPHILDMTPALRYTIAFEP